MNRKLKYNIKISISLFFILAVNILIYPYYIAEAASAPPNLFSTEDIKYTEKRYVDNYTIQRTRLAYVNFAILEQYNTKEISEPAEQLRLNLFSEISLTASLDHVEVGYQDTLIWIGSVDGATYSEVMLAYKDGILVGDIRIEQSLYQIKYVGNSIHAIQEIDLAAFPPEANPVSSPSLPKSIFPETLSSRMTDDGSQIDVLVVYTAAARDGAGGTTAMQNLISLAESQTNTGYNRSGVIQRIQVVHTAEISYNESGVEWRETLDRLTEIEDGYMDKVHNLRDTHLADLVVLIVNSCFDDICGIAWVNSSASHAFSVVARTSATARYTFAHEMGHNMGCAHDRTNAKVDGKYTYSYGYRVDSVFSTIMAYTNCPNGCPRINNWSNPEVKYSGYSTGVHYQNSNAADNRRTLNNTRVTVANFRTPDSTPPTPASNVRPDGWTGPYTSDTTPRFRWDPASDDGSGLGGYYVAVDDWTPDNNDWTTENTAFTVPDALSDGEYHFAVTSYDNANNLNPSNTNQHGDAPYYTFVVDTTAPSNPKGADSGCAAQNNVWQRACTDPNFTWSGADDHGGSGVKDYYVYWGTDPAGVPIEHLTTATYNPGAIETGNGVITYYLRIATRDNLDHKSSPTTVFTLLYDSVSPTGSPTVNKGAQTVYQVDVIIEPNAQDRGSGVAQIKLANNNTDWQSHPYAPSLIWSLAPYNRTLHTIKMQVEDKAGNSSAQYAQEVCLDFYPAHPASASYRLWSASFTAAGGRLTSDNLYPPSPHSQNYQLCQDVLSAGGTTSLTSNSYTLASTIGQSSASNAEGQQSSSYMHHAGFWANTTACPSTDHAFSYQLDQTVGQFPSGQSLSSASYQVHSGFQAMWPAQPDIEMFTAFKCDTTMAAYLPLVMRSVP